jgi:minor extracellular serine protease Vpr
VHRRKLTVLVLAAIAVAAVGLGGASAASGQGRFQMNAKYAVAGVAGSAPFALSNASATYILEVAGKPVALVDAAHRAAGHARMNLAQRDAVARQIRAKQAPVIAALKQLPGAHVNYAIQGVYNGISVAIPQREAYKLSSIPGVKAVFASKTYTLASVAPGDGLPLVNAPQTWGGTGQFNGTGIKIADLDTGIDYTHADFGGTGTTAAYQCARANDTADLATFQAACPGVSDWVTGSKIKGGIDLVGDAYNAAAAPGSPALTPHPDPNPLDCNGHGSHTAGTLGGFGVDQNGNTYSGSYNASTINNTSFIIPPGVAPKASIYAVRVFGCSGSVDNSVLLDAMNWAFNNGMDVVNMSLGAPFGNSTDPDAVAADNLAKEGVITVVASGNNGPNPYITSSPAAGTGALSVAANDSTAATPGANLALTKPDTTSGGTLASQVSNGASITPGTYALHVITVDGGTNFPGNISKGCSAADDMAQNGGNPWPANTILVVKRGVCGRVAKAIYGQQAGAAGVIMVNNSTAYPPYEGPITTNPDNGQPYTVTIPFFGVPGGSNPTTSAAGQALLAADGGTVTVSANGGITNPAYKALASFSSWGPAAGGMMKPEVTAPGVSILSASVGTGNGGAFLSGTSMATPHTAGVAALVKQAHPNWGGVSYWKAAIENTANPANVAGYAIRGAGAGEVDAFNATHTTVVATADDGTASLSYGVADMTSKFIGEKTITLTNFSGAPATFHVTHVVNQGVAHNVSVDTGNSNAPAKIRVPAHGTATVTVTVSVTKKNAADPVGAYNDWWGSSKFDDAAGLVTFTPLQHDNHQIALSVPFYVVPTAVANATVNGLSNAALVGGATDGNVTVTNAGGVGRGFADWFSWSGSSPVSQSDLGSADLLNAGIQSFPTGNPASSFVVFALQTTKPWSNPAMDQMEVDVDVNGDGIPDYAVVAEDNGGRFAGSSNGVPTIDIYNVTTHRWSSLGYLAGAMFNGTTMELPVTFSQLCQANSPCVSPNTAIQYAVFSSDRNGGADNIGAEDPNTGAFTSTAAPFNIFNPSLVTSSPGAEDVVKPNHTVTDPISFNAAAWNANPQNGILVLLQNNQNTLGEAETFSVHP